MQLSPVPPQPPETSWKFVDELRQPRHQPRPWRRRQPRPDEISLAAGVEIMPGFDDPDNCLETAYADLREFLQAASIPAGGGYRIATGRAPTPCYEAYRLEITETACRILADDTEGIRRGIYFLEDEIARTGGPFLKPGVTERRPAVKTRVSRCFFGPIKRPPKMRDELMDEVDYYPDHYLARLAYEGINGLWLTVEFKDLARTDLAPEYGADRDRRLAKLQRTIRQCRRYGIKIYLFAIEPLAWPLDSPVLRRHPELGGIRLNDRVAFCPFSDTARRYLHDCLRSIFADAPGLGGLINISLGERGTTCALRGAPCQTLCRRGIQAQPWEIIRETMAAMQKGMHAAAPETELICWLYVPGNSTGAASANFEWIKEIAGHIPPEVIFQYNFESNGRKEQLGKPRHAGDYWLSYVGPSGIFEQCAARARAAGARVSAKLQVACSHEVATVPYVPVPSSLYRKYAEMRRLDVSAVMMCWYFGNYPGIMNKAAGELAFEPFPAGEREFLRRLAAIAWADRADDAARAYELLWQGYENYPVNCMMQYYGPMHDGPVWPLFLAPADAPLAPTWLLKMDYSGDRVGEAINYSHTFEEVLELCGAMSKSWNRGVAMLKDLLRDFVGRADRAREVGIAEALGIHFQSASHIFQFYHHRERLFRGEVRDPRATLQAMRGIVEAELALDARLLELAEADATLGFHPEAEGYKYFPAKIHWRMRQLQNLLEVDFPRLAEQIRAGAPLFPEYTGKTIAGLAADCPRRPAAGGDGWRDRTWETNRHITAQHMLTVQPVADPPPAWQAAWQAAQDADALYFRARCPAAGAAEIWRKTFPGQEIPAVNATETLAIEIEPRRLWPTETFLIDRAGNVAYRAVSGRRQPGDWGILERAEDENFWTFTFRLPWSFFEGMAVPGRPIRVNVIHRWEPGAGGIAVWSSWAPPARPPFARLGYGFATPAELGWLQSINAQT